MYIRMQTLVWKTPLTPGALLLHVCEFARCLLTCASVADDEDGVSDMPQLLQLHHLQHKVVLRLKSKVLWGEGGEC